MLFILGSEYGIVLLSTVRSRHMSQDSGETADIGWIRKNLGFVTDPHRICVGITRSKYGLVIVGEQINSTATCVSVIQQPLYQWMQSVDIWTVCEGIA